MSMSNFIPELLKLKDPNIEFSNNVSKIKKKNVTYNLINAKLSYIPKYCPICGCFNEHYSIIKYGTKPSDIKLLPCNEIQLFFVLTNSGFSVRNVVNPF